MNTRDFGLIIKKAAVSWQSDKAARLGAALAYYSAFSIGPLLLLTVGVAGLIFGKDAARGRLLSQIRSVTGNQAGEVLETMLAAGEEPGAGTIATVTGSVMLVLGAAGVFGALQDALNTIWEVEPKSDRGIWGIVQDRFLSLTMVLGFAFLLLVSLIVSSGLAAITSLLQGWWEIGVAGQVADFILSLVVIMLLFASIFKYLPDALVAWKDVWFGAAVTSFLFTVGKLAIGFYLGHSAIASAYGAAGSLAVLLVWLYYSAQIFLFGAELTKAHATLFGRAIFPAPNAERVTLGTRQRAGMLTDGSMSAAHVEPR
jgi:membrane protein